MSNKYAGLGFSLNLNSTAIAGIRGISHGEASGDSVDITVLEDWTTSDRYRRKAGGLVDPGSLNLELAYDPEDVTHKTLIDALDSGVEQTFTVVFPTTTIIQTITGIINGVGQEIPLGELVTCSVRIDKSGHPGFAHT